MHIHSYTSSDLGEREPASDYYGNKGSGDAEAHRLATFAATPKVWKIGWQKTVVIALSGEY
jgi:uncharacterized protein